MYNFTSDIPIIDSEMNFLSNTLSDSSSLRHHNCRFLTVLNGSVKFSFEEEQFTLSKDDTLYIPCDHSYRIQAETASIVLYIGFHPCFLLNSIGFQYKKIVCNSTKDSACFHQEFRRLMATLTLAVSGNTSNNHCGIYACAYETLHYISRNFISKSKNESRSDSRKKLSKDELLRFLSQNYSYAVSLTQAAGALGYTPQYLSSFIKKSFNQTFNGLLNHYRLEAAIDYLKYTRESTTRIACLCGFPNTLSYSSTFKKQYGSSPEDYLEKHPVAPACNTDINFNTITGQTAVRNYILNYMNYVREPITLTDHTLKYTKQINVNHAVPMDSYWKTLINLGCIDDFEKPAFRKHLRMMQEELGFEYGRISGCLPLTRTYKLENATLYDFSRIFETIDFLKSIHLKPFLDIDNKPFRIYKEEPDKSLSYTEVLGTEEYDAFLLETLPHFIKASINRYGFDDFCTWKFELWRRYTPSMSSLESPKCFARRFEQIAGIFKRMHCQFSLGGPGFNSYLPTSHFVELLLALKGSAFQPDFISAYYFPYAPRGADDQTDDRGYLIEQSSDAMPTKIDELCSALKKCGYSDLPFYITEYTPYILSGNYVNDSTYSATCIFNQIVKNYGKIDALGYWLASDISLEHKLSSSPLFGGNGILSKNGIRKSSYHAFDFLNKLGPFLLASGEHYLITKSDEYRIQILTYYNNDITASIAEDPMSSELLHYPYYGSADVPPLELQLQLTNMYPGTYRIKECTLDLTHGNVLHVWAELDHIRNPLPADIEYMQNQSNPRITQRTQQIQDSFLLHSRLGQNEAKLFTLELYL